jgi:hypothetical protein
MIHLSRTITYGVLRPPIVSYYTIKSYVETEQQELGDLRLEAKGAQSRQRIIIPGSDNPLYLDPHSDQAYPSFMLGNYSINMRDVDGKRNMVITSGGRDQFRGLYLPFQFSPSGYIGWVTRCTANGAGTVEKLEEIAKKIRKEDRTLR